MSEAVKTNTARAILADPNLLNGLTEDAINAIALVVQKAIGQDNGGIAGLHFSDDARRNEIKDAVRLLLEMEAIYEDGQEEDEQPDCVRTGHHMDDGRGACRFNCGHFMPDRPQP